jgi:hypothetical protein
VCLISVHTAISIKKLNPVLMATKEGHTFSSIKTGIQGLNLDVRNDTNTLKTQSCDSPE